MNCCGFNMNKNLKSIAYALSCLVANIAYADYPRDWQINFQTPASPVMEKILTTHNLLLIIIFAISIFVVALLGYTCYKFSAKRNKNPSTTTHNTLIEVVWTAIPVLILVAIVVPSLKLLYFEHKTEDAELNIKVIGHQWYWEYVYPDNDNIRFDSYMVQDKDLKPGQLRLLEVDNRLVIPAGVKVRFLITSADVLHSFAMPSMAIKKDAVPGRTNESWTMVEKPGVYYGQCSELCGVGHGFMPIAMEVKSKEDFAKWLEEAKVKFGS